MRSLLFVPGSQPHMLDRAPTRLADVLVPDLEDSVADSGKAAARDNVAAALPALIASGRPILPRVNSLASGWLESDLASVVRPGILGIAVGKFHAPDDVARIERALEFAERRAGIQTGSLRLVLWLETASAIVHAHAICGTSPRIAAVAFGAEDYTEDMQIERTADDSELVYPRSVIVVAARAAGVIALDTPYMNFRDPAGLEQRARAGCRLGFRGQFAIHPDQVEPIHRAFAPSAQEIAQARRIIEAFELAERTGQGATSLDGIVIDVPVAKRARAVLARAVTE